MSNSKIRVGSTFVDPKRGPVKIVRKRLFGGDFCFNGEAKPMRRLRIDVTPVAGVTTPIRIALDIEQPKKRKRSQTIPQTKLSASRPTKRHIDVELGVDHVTLVLPEGHPGIRVEVRQGSEKIKAKYPTSGE